MQGNYLLVAQGLRWWEDSALHFGQGAFTTPVGTSNTATAYGLVVQSGGAYITGNAYVQGGLFLNGQKRPILPCYYFIYLYRCGSW